MWGRGHAGVAEHCPFGAALVDGMNDETITITTASGTTYHLRGSQLARLRGGDSAPLRADGAPIEVLAATTPFVGECWVLVLRAGGRTWARATSRVVSVDVGWHDDDHPGT